MTPYQPGKPIEELERELGLIHIVKLASNENPLGLGERAKAAIAAASADIARYPDGGGFSLKAALAAKHSIQPGQITLGNGSSEILELAARAFLTPEHESVFARHAFALYPILTQAAGAVARIAPARDYGHDLAAMRALINERTRLAFIANPNNPTGVLLSPSEVEAFIAELPEHVICVLDEAYYEFVAPELRAETLHWPERYPNLLVTRTFSKAYGLAGLRIGYGVSSPELADILNRVRQPFNNSNLALAAAEAALDDADFLQRTLALNQAGMRQLTEAFAELGLEWIPSHGNFIAVRVGEGAFSVYEALLRKGVIVRPVANYDLPEYVRVSIGTEAENQTFIEALRQVLAGV